MGLNTYTDNIHLYKCTRLILKTKNIMNVPIIGEKK